MNHIQEATPESVWVFLREIAERQAETDRQMKETERFLNAKFAETDRQMKETERFLNAKFAETDKLLNEKFAETDRQRKENERILNEKFADTDLKIKKVSETLGSWAINQGFFAEEYFYNSFEKGNQNFFGEKFDEIEKNVKGLKKHFKDEYDILLINGKSIGIIEVKYKAHVNDIVKVLKKASTFRINFPDYTNHQVYLGLATMVFYPELEQECINEGIAIIKQVGDSVVMNDKHLKVF